MAKGLPRSHNAANKSIAPIVKDTIVIKNKTVTLTEDAGGQPAWATLQVGDFPEGNILFLGAASYFQFSGSGSDGDLSDVWQGNYGVGTTPSTDDTTPLATTMEDIIAVVAIAAATAEVSPKTRSVSTDGEAGVLYDNTDGSLELNLNILVNAAHISGDDSVLTITGELYIAYIVLGND